MVSDSCGGSSVTSTGTNGSLSGHIWHQNGGSTYRFDLKTGLDEMISNQAVTPSYDGSLYIGIRRDVQSVSALGSYCGERFDVDEIQFRDTESTEVIHSFQTQLEIYHPVKIDPSLRRIMSLSNEHVCDRNRFDDQKEATVYSLLGTFEHRFPSNVIAWEFLSDSRIAVLQSNGGGNYSLHIETAPGSYAFPAATQWTFPPGTPGQRMRGLRANPDGTKFLMEIVLDESRVTTVNFRYSDIAMLDLATSSLGPVFVGNEPDGSLRAAEGLFSPDGQFILTTQDFWSGGAVVDTGAFSLPSSGVTYVVPSSTQSQPLPPFETNSSIQAVLRDTGVGLQSKRLNPTNGLFWTPPIP